jgi:multisubunit Na+/H+ antiporter MnhB subunit
MFKSLLILLFGIFPIFINGFVLEILWGWFAVPIFGLPQLAFIPACGIVVLINQAFKPVKAHHNKEEAEETTSEVFASILNLIITPSLLLFYGWILHYFM